MKNHKNFLVVLRYNGLVSMYHFDKKNFFKTRKLPMRGYSAFRDNYFWYIQMKIKDSAPLVKDDRSFYDVLWTDQHNKLTCFGHLDIEPAPKQLIQKVSKDYRLQGTYNFTILYDPPNGLKRLRGTIARVLKYTRAYTIKRE